MKKTFNLLIISLIPVFLLSSISGRKIIADKSSSTIVYAMKHPMHEWEGICKDVGAVIVFNDALRKVEQVAVISRVDCFDSDNSNRDSHAIEVLEGLKYPKVAFTSNDIKSDGDYLQVKGNLTFHGVTRAISFKVSPKEANGKLTIEGVFHLLLSDYGVERPSLVGIKAEDLIKIRLRIVFGLK